ncbi:chemotaxis protein CheA [Desulfovibrio inopinatus]|uniref:chemotaxis protein CheA n=1 Tax=Desulfovibrio inopinatus TaxID=102109 RepID=UPI0003F62615|nr:chemotaxis protein CheW [Desulfovibrio inopinatus]
MDTDRLYEEIEDRLGKLEEAILFLESQGTGQANAGHVLAGLGLSRAEGLGPHVGMLLDLFADGVVPPDAELVDSLVVMVESLKRFLFELIRMVSGESQPSQGSVFLPFSGEPVGERTSHPQGEAAALSPVSPTDSPVESVPSPEIKKPTTFSVEGNSSENNSLPIRRAGDVVKVATTHLDELAESLKELIISTTMIRGHRLVSEQTNRELFDIVLDQARSVETMRHSIMAIRRVSLGSLFNRMGRLARDVATKLEKQIDVEFEGSHVELDKTVVDRLGDPLVHLVRNAVDHGIEPPNERTQQGKAETGTLRLIAEFDEEHIIIALSDDGRGLNRDAIFTKAIEKGLAVSGQNLADEEVYAFVMSPGFSTAKNVTDISGRGVGMDVVGESVRDLGGRITIASAAGEGTTFRIILPQARSVEGISDGIVVMVEGQRYVVASNFVAEVAQPEAGDVSMTGGAMEIFRYRGAPLPLIRLRRVFQCPLSSDPEDEQSMILVVDALGHRFAVMADDVEGETQVVIRPLDRYHSLFQNRLFSGMTLIGEHTGLAIDMDKLVLECTVNS